MQKLMNQAFKKLKSKNYFLVWRVSLSQKISKALLQCRASMNLNQSGKIKLQIYSQESNLLNLVGLYLDSILELIAKSLRFLFSFKNNKYNFFCLIQTFYYRNQFYMVKLAGFFILGILIFFQSSNIYQHEESLYVHCIQLKNSEIMQQFILKSNYLAEIFLSDNHFQLTDQQIMQGSLFTFKRKAASIFFEILTKKYRKIDRPQRLLLTIHSSLF